jgi:hypothetical protein
VTDTPNPTAPPAPVSLAERARAAAANRTGRHDPAWGNTRWVTRAQQCAARLTLILAVPADQIHLEASTLRRYGDWPWPELTVPDGEQRFRFIAAYCDPDQITALEQCPFCENEVPTFPVRSLADLGDLITGRTTDNDIDLSCAFDQDPGHQPDCPHTAPTA